MKRFDVFESPDGHREAVKDGFSWPGFFFKWVWAFVKGMPGRGFMFIGATILAGILDAQAADGPLAFLTELTELSLAFWVGRDGNEWRRSALYAKGCRWLGTFEADSPEAALAAASSHQIEDGEGAAGPADRVDG